MGKIKEEWLEKIKGQVEENFSQQTEFLGSLVERVSRNPGSNMGKGVEVEMGVARLIRGKLNEMGVRSRYLRARSNRPNVVAIEGPLRTRKSLMLVGHMDTAVRNEDEVKVLNGLVREGKIYGEGVLDMKASLSAYVYALKAIKDLKIKLDGKLKLAFVADGKGERPSKWGLQFLLNKGLSAKVALLAKPGSDKIAIGHRGGYRFVLRTFGQAVDTGRRVWEKGKVGKNAIVDMSRVIKALSSFELPFKQARAFLGRKPVFTFPTKISGGSFLDVVPDKCEAYGDVRLMPGNTDMQVKIWIQEKMNELPDVKWEMEDLLYVPSVEIDRNELIVQTLAANAKLINGSAPKIEGYGPWNDSWMLTGKSIPCIAGFGPDGGDEGVEGEWVELASLKRFTKILALSMVEYLGVEGESAEVV